MEVNREIEIYLSIEDVIKLLKEDWIREDGFVIKPDFDFNYSHLKESLEKYEKEYNYEN